MVNQAAATLLKASRCYTQSLRPDQSTPTEQSETTTTPSTESTIQSDLPETEPDQNLTHMPLPSDFPFFSGKENDVEKPGTWLKHLEHQ